MVESLKALLADWKETRSIIYGGPTRQDQKEKKIRCKII